MVLEPFQALAALIEALSRVAFSDPWLSCGEVVQLVTSSHGYGSSVWAQHSLDGARGKLKPRVAEASSQVVGTITGFEVAPRFSAEAMLARSQAVLDAAPPIRGRTSGEHRRIHSVCDGSQRTAGRGIVLRNRAFWGSLRGRRGGCQIGVWTGAARREQ
jgi:hypothetical protein